MEVQAFQKCGNSHAHMACCQLARMKWRGLVLCLGHTYTRSDNVPHSTKSASALRSRKSGKNRLAKKKLEAAGECGLHAWQLGRLGNGTEL